MAENESPGHVFINVKVARKTRDAWKEALDAKGTTISEVVRKALQRATGIKAGPMGPGYDS